MPVTERELAEFNRYAIERISSGGAESMPELFREWLDACSAADVDDAIREGIADVDAGRTRPFSQSQAPSLRKNSDASDVCRRPYQLPG
jgi:hypothetical protein